jgi:hypothetical protein
MEIKSRAYEKYSWYSGGIVANCEGAWHQNQEHSIMYTNGLACIAKEV